MPAASRCPSGRPDAQAIRLSWTCRYAAFRGRWLFSGRASFASGTAQCARNKTVGAIFRLRTTRCGPTRRIHVQTVRAFAGPQRARDPRPFSHRLIRPGPYSFEIKRNAKAESLPFGSFFRIIEQLRPRRPGFIQLFCIWFTKSAYRRYCCCLLYRLQDFRALRRTGPRLRR